MGWKFWKKNENGAAQGKSQKLGKPREIPQEVGRYLVVAEKLDPDWVWSLMCVRRPRENSKSIFDIRIFSAESAAQKRVKVRDYVTLDNHMDLVLFAGWYNRETNKVELERLIDEAV
jgi:hypothetical protein